MREPCKHLCYGRCLLGVFAGKRSPLTRPCETCETFSAGASGCPPEPAATAGLRRSSVVSGPGSQLKRLLQRLGIYPSGECFCAAHAAVMDAKGVPWCKENVDRIVGWMRSEATTRKMPFMDWPARLLVKRAIKLAAAAQKVSSTRR